MLDGVISSGNGGMPSLLRKSKSSNPVSKPLSGDVLRAFDAHNTALAAAAEGGFWGPSDFVGESNYILNRGCQGLIIISF